LKLFQSMLFTRATIIVATANMHIRSTKGRRRFGRHEAAIHWPNRTPRLVFFGFGRIFPSFPASPPLLSALGAGGGGDSESLVLRRGASGATFLTDRGG